MKYFLKPAQWNSRRTRGNTVKDIGKWDKETTYSEIEQWNNMAYDKKERKKIEYLKEDELIRDARTLLMV